MTPSTASNKAQKVNAAKESKLPAGANMDHQKKQKDKKERIKDKKTRDAHEHEAGMEDAFGPATELGAGLELL
jgi:hypothetical protein